jgi:hypothetical protein
LGKGSFTGQNQARDFYVGNSTSLQNEVYTNVKKWLGSIKHKSWSSFEEANKSHPVLFICGEWPFHGHNTKTLKPRQKSGENWVIHVDLSSRLGCYLLGPYAVGEFYRQLNATQKARVALVP